MNPLDSSKYLRSEKIQNWFVNGLVDLTSTSTTAPYPSTVPTVEGKSLVYTETVPDSQIIVVKTVVPYAMARVNVGTDSEYVQMISAQNACNFFLFEPKVNSASALGASGFNFDAMTNAADATAADDKTGSGIPFVSDSPLDTALRTLDTSLFGFIVPAGATLNVLFSLVPAANTGALKARYTIVPNYSAQTAGTKRVDFAGVIMAGVKMAKSYYDSEYVKAVNRKD